MYMNMDTHAQTRLYTMCTWDHVVLPQGSQVCSPRQSHSKDSAGCNSWWIHLRWKTPPGCGTKVYWPAVAPLAPRSTTSLPAEKLWKDGDWYPILGRFHWENDDQTWDCGWDIGPHTWRIFRPQWELQCGFHRACDSEQPIIIPQTIKDQPWTIADTGKQEQLKGEDSTTGESHMIAWHGLTSTLQHVVLRSLESLKMGDAPKIIFNPQSNWWSTMGFVWALYFPKKSIFFCSPLCKGSFALDRREGQDHFVLPAVQRRCLTNGPSLSKGFYIWQCVKTLYPWWTSK